MSADTRSLHMLGSPCTIDLTTEGEDQEHSSDRTTPQPRSLPSHFGKPNADPHSKYNEDDVEAKYRRAQALARSPPSASFQQVVKTPEKRLPSAGNQRVDARAKLLARLQTANEAAFKTNKKLPSSAALNASGATAKDNANDKAATGALNRKHELEASLPQNSSKRLKPLPSTEQGQVKTKEAVLQNTGKITRPLDHNRSLPQDASRMVARTVNSNEPAITRQTSPLFVDLTDDSMEEVVQQNQVDLSKSATTSDANSRQSTLQQKTSENFSAAQQKNSLGAKAQDAKPTTTLRTAPALNVVQQHQIPNKVNPANVTSSQDRNRRSLLTLFPRRKFQPKQLAAKNADLPGKVRASSSTGGISQNAQDISNSTGAPHAHDSASKQPSLIMHSLYQSETPETEDESSIISRNHRKNQMKERERRDTNDSVFIAEDNVSTGMADPLLQLHRQRKDEQPRTGTSSSLDQLLKDTTQHLQNNADGLSPVDARHDLSFVDEMASSRNSMSLAGKGESLSLNTDGNSQKNSYRVPQSENRLVQAKRQSQLQQHHRSHDLGEQTKNMTSPLLCYDDTSTDPDSADKMHAAPIAYMGSHVAKSAKSQPVTRTETTRTDLLPQVQAEQQEKRRREARSLESCRSNEHDPVVPQTSHRFVPNVHHRRPNEIDLGQKMTSSQLKFKHKPDRVFGAPSQQLNTPADRINSRTEDVSKVTASPKCNRRTVDVGMHLSGPAFETWQAQSSLIKEQQKCQPITQRINEDQQSNFVWPKDSKMYDDMLMQLRARYPSESYAKLKHKFFEATGLFVPTEKLKNRCKTLNKRARNDGIQRDRIMIDLESDSDWDEFSVPVLDCNGRPTTGGKTINAEYVATVYNSFDADEVDQIWDGPQGTQWSDPLPGPDPITQEDICHFGYCVQMRQVIYSEARHEDIAVQDWQDCSKQYSTLDQAKLRAMQVALDLQVMPFTAYSYKQVDDLPLFTGQNDFKQVEVRVHRFVRTHEQNILPKTSRGFMASRKGYVIKFRISRLQMEKFEEKSAPAMVNNAAKMIAESKLATNEPGERPITDDSIPGGDESQLREDDEHLVNDLAMYLEGASEAVANDKRDESLFGGTPDPKLKDVAGAEESGVDDESSKRQAELSSDVATAVTTNILKEKAQTNNLEDESDESGNDDDAATVVSMTNSAHDDSHRSETSRPAERRSTMGGKRPVAATKPPQPPPVCVTEEPEWQGVEKLADNNHYALLGQANEVAWDLLARLRQEHLQGFFASRRVDDVTRERQEKEELLDDLAKQDKLFAAEVEGMSKGEGGSSNDDGDDSDDDESSAKTRIEVWVEESKWVGPRN